MLSMEIIKEIKRGHGEEGQYWLPMKKIFKCKDNI